jgi:hypothetical protein
MISRGVKNLFLLWWSWWKSEREKLFKRRSICTHEEK